MNKSITWHKGYKAWKAYLSHEYDNALIGSPSPVAIVEPIEISNNFLYMLFNNPKSYSWVIFPPNGISKSGKERSEQKAIQEAHNALMVYFLKERDKGLNNE